MIRPKAWFAQVQLSTRVWWKGKYEGGRGGWNCRKRDWTWHGPYQVEESVVGFVIEIAFDGAVAGYAWIGN